MRNKEREGEGENLTESGEGMRERGRKQSRRVH